MDINENEWHNWYAWFPVYIGTFFVWNRVVQRKLNDVADIPQDCMYNSLPKWQYRIIYN